MSSTYYEDMGVQLQIGDGASPESFTLIPQIVSIGEVTGEYEELDATTLDSTIVERPLSALENIQDISVTAIWNPSNTVHQGVLTDKTNRTVRNFKLVLTDTGSTEIAFSAQVKSASTPAGAERGNPGRMTFVLTPQSKPVITTS